MIQKQRKGFGRSSVEEEESDEEEVLLGDDGEDAGGLPLLFRGADCCAVDGWVGGSFVRSFFPFVLGRGWVSGWVGGWVGRTSRLDLEVKGVNRHQANGQPTGQGGPADAEDCHYEVDPIACALEQGEAGRVLALLFVG